jgi:hypothetical protein
MENRSKSGDAVLLSSCPPAFSFWRVADHLPSVTILIAARPDQADVKARTASLALDYPRELLEILIARGRQPSAQRNSGLRAARGEIVYFLDDDSVPLPSNLRRAMTHFSDPQVQMVGGPNVCPPDAPELEQVFALVLSSRLAFGPSRARYAPVGEVRATSEKELILCNLAARKDAILELGGFNEALYPNEENALMDELVKRGGKLLYDPKFLVHRRPRPDLRAFCRMLMTYGRGRAEQFRVNPTPGSILNFVPPAFLVYLLLLPAGLWWLGLPAAIPLALYVLVTLAEGAALFARSTLSRALGAVPLITLTHVLYGAGFWGGLFTRLRSPGSLPPGQVILETVRCAS